MRAITIACWTIVMVFGLGGAAAAQLDPEARDVVEAVLRDRVERVADGAYGLPPNPRLALDPQLLVGANLGLRDGVELDSVALSYLTEATGISVVRLADVYSCESPSPASCRLEGVDMVIRVGEPELDGDTAVVGVRHRTYVPSDAARQPVHSGAQILELARTDGVWRIVRILIQSTT